MAEDSSHLTTSDYLSVYVRCKAVNSPDRLLQSVGYFLTGTEGCLISQVLGQREGENEGELGEESEEKGCHGLHSLQYQQRKACAIIIHLSPFSSPGTIFFSVPARTGVALTTPAPPDCDLIATPGLGNHIWLTDSQTRFLAKEREGKWPRSW